MGKGDGRSAKRKVGPREPNGRPSRKKEHQQTRRDEAARKAFEESPMQTVLRARRRHRTDFREPAKPEVYREADAKPVSKPQADRLRLKDRGSVLDRLWSEGHLTDTQRAAGLDYCARYVSYAALNGLPRPTPQGPAYGEVRGGSRPDRLKAAMVAKAEHTADQMILRRCSAGVLWAIKRACVTDDPAPLHLVKEGLQALVANGR